jgi:hypothetical protein
VAIWRASSVTGAALNASSLRLPSWSIPLPGLQLDLAELWAAHL